jgi:hypothetical protein
VSALTDRITEVQAAHRWATIPAGAWAAGRYICAGCEAISKTLSEHEVHVAERIEAEVWSWDGLMALLDAQYPENVFPTLEDRPDRDNGPRIVSLIRQIHQLRQETKP